MHMHRTARIICCGVLIGLCVGAGSAEPFEFGREREWDFHGQAKFRGSLVKIDDGKAFIRMSDGIVREFRPGTTEGVSGSFLQRAMCRLPNEPARPVVTPGTAPLIDLAAANLTPGPLAQWKNRGSLGGSFTAMNQPPTVTPVQGRNAVVFVHAPWLLPLEFQTMVSDFIMPEPAIGGDAMTVVAWLCNTGPVVDRETFLCWGEKDCGELDTPDFSYGCYEAIQWYNEKITFPPARFPRLNRWHQLAYVVAPLPGDKNRCEMRIYADGEAITSKPLRKPAAKLLKNNLAFLGCAWEAWWGHAWATHPARPYTGAIARLQVYDRALSPAEIRKLDGKEGAPAPTPIVLAATDPQPATGAREVPPSLVKLSWTPSPNAAGQVLYFGSDKDAVVRGKASSLKLKAQVEEIYIPLDLKLASLECGKSYYWRVEAIAEAKQGTPAGEPWSFTTSAFNLEFDGPVSEAFPKEVVQDGFYERYMDAGGYPIISPPGNQDIHLRAARHGLQKLLGKRPDLVKALQSQHAATHLASQENRGWGWSQFTCSSYGAGEAILREGAILMHEMGHQFHMQGAEAMDPEFRHRLGEVFNAAERDRLWIGDYGGNNMWENVAVCASWWINDMTQDEGVIRPRELLRRSDPRIYHLLAAYWPGDLMIDLQATEMVRTDPTGNLLEWGNRGGIEYFKPNVGWRRYERSVGRFTPVKGKPSLRTVGGVSAIALGGSDALGWNQTSWDALDGNRSWSVDARVYREHEAAGEQVVVDWGTQEQPGAKLLWGGSHQACEFPGGISGRWSSKPDAGRWHHLAWVFTGGGAEDAPGECRLYVDGKLDSSTRMKLALPPNSTLTIGRGFIGALANVRVYNYDLHPLQIEAMWTRESPAYRADGIAVSGRLLVDLDVRQLAPVFDSETWPGYPTSLNKPWLRSWVNRGVLGGKLHNDANGPKASQPRHGVAHGAGAIAFDGTSRMISSFAVPAPAEGTMELWAFPEPGAENGTILQWGDWSISGKLLRPGIWQHVTVFRQKGVTTTFVNGTIVPGAPVAIGAAGSDRLILGGAWGATGFINGFHGHISQLRVHEGILKAEQILANVAQRPGLPALASQPKPELLIDLDAAALPAGSVKAWPNRSSAGGVFVLATERETWRPLVVTIDGRNGVDFSGRKFLLSSFPAPPALLGTGSFTVSVWAYCRDSRGLEREQTMLSWGSRPGERAEFRWGSDSKRGAFVGARTEFGFNGPEMQPDRLRHNAPLLNGWRHVAYAYNGPTRKLRIYVDGKLNREESVDLRIAPGGLICLGGARNTQSLDVPFTGILGEVAIAEGVLDDAMICRLSQGTAVTAIQGNWLVRLESRDLGTGPLASWRNQGSLGGEFLLDAEDLHAPRAEQVGSRAAVTFDGQAALRSDIPTPPALTGDRPFTVEMWVLNPKIAEVETVFSMAPSVAMKSYLYDVNTCAASFNFGVAKDSGRSLRPGVFSTGAGSRNIGWKDRVPAAGQWQHLACVYTGGYRSSFKVYLNGEPVNERGFFTLDTIAGYPMHLGTAWNTARGAVNPFTGSLARLKVYNYARADQEIRAAAAEK